MTGIIGLDLSLSGNRAEERQGQAGRHPKGETVRPPDPLSLNNSSYKPLYQKLNDEVDCYSTSQPRKIQDYWEAVYGCPNLARQLEHSDFISEIWAHSSC